MQQKPIKKPEDPLASKEEELQKKQWEEEDRLSKQQEVLLKKTQSFEEAMHKPVSSHVEKIEENLNYLLKDLENSRKDLQNLKTELQKLEQLGLDQNSDLNRMLFNEIMRVEDNFRKSGKKDREELDFFGQQMKFLKHDKTKLEDAMELLGLRVNECENDVGFRFVYD